MSGKFKLIKKLIVRVGRMLKTLNANLVENLISWITLGGDYGKENAYKKVI